jgi:glycosyltransferase involved in cell wall biosynthesis
MFYSLVSSPERLGANEVHRLLLSDDWRIITFRKHSGEVFHSRDHCLKLSRLTMFSILFPLVKLFKIVPSGSCLLADGIFPIIVARLLSILKNDIKVIALIHNDYTVNNRTRWKFIPDSVFNALYRCVLFSVPKIVTTSMAAMIALEREGYKDICCIGNIVEPLELDNGLGGDIAEFWYIGRLVAAKNVHDILRVAKARDRVKFNIVGDGAEYDRLVVEAPENVKFYGFVDRPFDLTAVGDVFMLPSSVEGRSLALMKAASSRMILCLSDIPENQFVDDLAGVYFHSVADVDSIVEVVDSINALSKEQRISKSIANKEIMDLSLNMTEFKERYKNLFLKL